MISFVTKVRIFPIFTIQSTTIYKRSQTIRREFNDSGLFPEKENSMQKISSLPSVQVHVVNESSSYTLICVERSNHASNDRLQESKNNGKFLKRLIVGVAYKRWSLSIASDYRTLNGKSLVFWIGTSRLRQVVAHGVSTVLWCCTRV